MARREKADWRSTMPFCMRTHWANQQQDLIALLVVLFHIYVVSLFYARGATISHPFASDNNKARMTRSFNRMLLSLSCMIADCLNYSLCKA